MQKRKNGFLLLLLLFKALQSEAQASSSEIYLQLKKLNVLGSVLYVAAHPDDENTRLITYLSKDRLYRTGYLSITRGDGGQNLIGDEQGVELGLIRTQELLSARGIDGGEQFFTRAYDFGFSKTTEETLKKWDRNKILSDVVWVIRKFRPDVVITRFPEDSRAGHGHHSASAVLAHEAFVAAGDPGKFPEQLQYGVSPWQPKRIVWNTYNFGGNNTTSEDQLKIDVGGYNALLGESYGEIAAESRSRHKSQGFGVSRQRGEAFEYFLHTDGDKAAKDLTDGVELGWKRVENGAAVDAEVNKIISNYSFTEPERSLPAFVKLYRLLGTYPASYWVDQKKKEVRNIMEACSGLYAEAYTDRPYVVPGDSLRITFNFNLRKAPGILEEIFLEDREIWDTVLNQKTSINKTIRLVRTVKVPETKAVSQPYWLKELPNNGMFVVNDQAQIGKPENEPAFSAVFVVEIDGMRFETIRPVVYRVVDPVKAEIHQPVYVLPPVDMWFEKENYLSLNDKPVKASIRLKSNSANALGYTIRMKHSENWRSDRPEITFTPSNGAGKEQTVTATLTPLSGKDNFREQVELVSKHGQDYVGYKKIIAYDHIPNMLYIRPAAANLIRSDVKTAGGKVGYIVGAGDKVPEALQTMGFDVQFLNESDLTEKNLKQFKAVVTGVRAYNVHRFLEEKYSVLMNYVKNGGNLIVQYNTNSNFGPLKTPMAPYPFVISRTRVTEEDSKVKMLLPDHPVLNMPNKITDRDFEYWVQERSVYQAEQPDAKYAAPLSMHDSAEKESSGSLLIAKYGKGNFVYASLAFFRQLPAGVPGAYRLMANLIALPPNP